MEQILWTLVWRGLSELAWFRRGWEQNNRIVNALTLKERDIQSLFDFLIWIIGLFILTY
jgi:hypothetical protein